MVRHVFGEAGARSSVAASKEGYVAELFRAVNRSTKIAAWILTLGAFACGVSGCKGNKTDGNGGSSGAVQTGKFGEPLAFAGDSTWTIEAAWDRGQLLLANGLADEQRTTGRFVSVHYRLRNDRTVAAGGDHSIPVVIDDRGRRFTHMKDDCEWAAKGVPCLDHALTPGIEGAFFNIYEIPMDANGLRLRVSPLVGQRPPVEVAFTPKPLPRPGNTVAAPASTIQCKRSPDVDNICENMGQQGFNCWGGTVGDVKNAMPTCELIADSKFCCSPQALRRVGVNF